MDDIPVVYAWREDEISAIQHRADWTQEIDCDSILEIVEWAERFSGNYRLPTDVGMPLERCVIAAYQIGYLYDYLSMKKDDSFYKYMGEGLASVLLHTIASYEMTGRGTHNIKLVTSYRKWSELCKVSFKSSLSGLGESMFKYQRWILYNHKGRTKRWDESEFNKQYVRIIFNCCGIARSYDVSLKEGFALTMSKIQDGEIKRH